MNKILLNRTELTSSFLVPFVHWWNTQRVDLYDNQLVIESIDIYRDF